MAEIQEVGFVKSEFKKSADPLEMRKHESLIIINEEYEEGLYRIEESRYIQVLFHFHLSRGYKLKGPTYSGEVKGVFACRSPRRPGAIGLTTVRLLERRGRSLKVQGLDAVDGTPVLDIKPYSNLLDEAEREKIEEDRLKASPRGDLIRLIRRGRLEQLLLEAGKLHGHFCPGLALGVMAGACGLNKLLEIGGGWELSDGMEDLIAIVETNNCFTDGVQYVTGCTLGNNALIFRDYGKTVVTLARREGRGVRLSVRPGHRTHLDEQFPAFRELFQTVVEEKDRSKEKVARFKNSAREASFALLGLDFDKIFKIEEVEADIPEYAPIQESVLCEECGESVMSSRAVQKERRRLCIPCSHSCYYQVEGGGIVQRTG